MTPGDRTPDDQFWFARLDNKLDDIKRTIGGHGEELAEHRVRLDNHDREIANLHAANKQAQEHRNTERRHRMTLWGGVIAAVVGSGALAILEFLVLK